MGVVWAERDAGRIRVRSGTAAGLRLSDTAAATGAQACADLRPPVVRWPKPAAFFARASGLRAESTVVGCAVPATSRSGRGSRRPARVGGWRPQS